MAQGHRASKKQVTGPHQTVANPRPVSLPGAWRSYSTTPGCRVPPGIWLSPVADCPGTGFHLALDWLVSSFILLPLWVLFISFSGVCPHTSMLCLPITVPVAHDSSGLSTGVLNSGRPLSSEQVTQ